MRKPLVLLAALCVLGGVAAATVAGFAGAARTATAWKVDLGQQGPSPAGVPKSVFLDQYFPGKLTINAGDKVTFSSATFHTATFLAKTKPQNFFIPDPAKSKYANILGADGKPFYFEGLPKFIYNPAVFGPVGGTAVSGNALVSSGVLSPGPKQHFATATFAFPSVGTFQLICLLHPHMQIDITVKPAGAALPQTPAQVAATQLSEINAAFQDAAATEKKTTAPANTIVMGAGDASTLLAFLPKTMTVKVGTTVKFVDRGVREVHDAAFGPQKWVEKFQQKTDLIPFGPKAPNQVTPVLLYGSDPKGQTSLDGTNHGNGFYVTALTTGSPLIPLPHTTSVTFTKPGTYHYFCLIHGPDMSGTITVTA